MKTNHCTSHHSSSPLPLPHTPLLSSHPPTHTPPLLPLSQDQPEVLQRKLDLEIDSSTQRDGQSLGHICVSVVFRSVSSVAMAGVCVRGCEGVRVYVRTTGFVEYTDYLFTSTFLLPPSLPLNSHSSFLCPPFPSSISPFQPSSFLFSSFSSPFPSPPLPSPLPLQSSPASQLSTMKNHQNRDGPKGQ